MKKVFLIIFIVLLLGLSWYLFLKPQDYRISFKANSIPGTINQTLKLWNGTLENNANITQNGTLKHLTQRIPINDLSTHQYDWFIEATSDSTSTVKVDVKDLNNSLMNKIRIPFSDTDFEKNSRKMVTDFAKKLKEHQDRIKITITGKDELSSTYCACVSLKSSQIAKAGEMMNNQPFLSSVISQNNISLNGVPFIHVTNWDIQNDSIAYDFCFPIVKPDSLPYIKGVEFKTFQGQKALKAIYNGNYITSDRAWYALLDYAQSNGIDIKKEPIEFFFSNPSMGDDELRWKAEIFMPLKN